MTIQFSYSRCDTFETCPRRYKYHYIDKFVVDGFTFANDPLICGTAVHHGVATSVEDGIREYYSNFPVASDTQVNEEIKLRHAIQELRKAINVTNSIFEFKIETPSFLGYVDYLEPKEDGSYLMLDFKYAKASNIPRYEESKQLHVYNDQLRRCYNINVSEMGFLLMPKTGIRQKKTETLDQFRSRLRSEISNMHPITIPIELSEEKISEFNKTCGRIMVEKEFPRQEGPLCYFCEYQEYCKQDGKEDCMKLPTKESMVAKERTNTRRLFLFGAPYQGKTVFATSFPDPFGISTDGNWELLPQMHPYIHLRNEVTTEGRITKTTLAWETFKEIISELEKYNNSYKTIVVDLLDDMYEYCRLWVFDQEGVSHESENSFNLYDKVRLEFLSTIKRLMNLDYDNILLLAHEDTSKDITQRSGNKITKIAPYINEKIATKLSGYADLTARVVCDRGVYKMTLKSDDIQFGGGRFNFGVKEIPLNYESFVEIYDKARGKTSPARQKPTVEAVSNDELEDTPVEEHGAVVPSEPPRRGRRPRGE